MAAETSDLIHAVTFPGLGLSFSLNRVAFSLFGIPIYWYGVIIVSGILLASLFCCRVSKRFGITSDQVVDLMLWAVPPAIVCLRAYYVIFNLEAYRNADGSLNWAQIINIRDGGLAIYGAIISSAIVLFLFCRYRKISFFAFADVGVHGLFLGQSIGRWGNFMNVEAFGSVTDVPWRMCGPSIASWLSSRGLVDRAGYDAILAGTLGVHPTFFYESAWNLTGFLLVWLLGRKRKFDGQCFLFYLFWYGLGRTWIEGLRTDSLYLFGLELFGYPVRVSQLISAVACITAGVLLVVLTLRFSKKPPVLYVETVELQKKAAQALSASQEAEGIPAQPADTESDADTGSDDADSSGGEDK